MSVPALDSVYALSGFFEASDQLRNVIRVPVTEPKLAVLVLFANSVDKTLLADEETEVKAT